MSVVEVVHGEHIIAARCTVCGFCTVVARVSGPVLDTSLPHFCNEDGRFVWRVDGRAYPLNPEPKPAPADELVRLLAAERDRLLLPVVEFLARHLPKPRAARRRRAEARAAVLDDARWGWSAPLGAPPLDGDTPGRP